MIRNNNPSFALVERFVNAIERGDLDLLQWNILT